MSRGPQYIVVAGAVGVVLAMVALQVQLLLVAASTGVLLVVVIRLLGHPESLRARYGVVGVVAGGACWAVAYYVSVRYNVPLESLSVTHAVPRIVRRLPFFGTALLAAGATVLAILWFVREPTKE
jgi:hypothetical protein